MNYISGYTKNNYAFIKEDNSTYSKLKSLSKLRTSGYPHYSVFTDKRVEAQYAMMNNIKVEAVDGVLHNLRPIHNQVISPVILGNACHTIDRMVTFPAGIYVLDDRIKHIHPDALGKGNPFQFEINVTQVADDYLLRQVYSGLAYSSAQSFINDLPQRKEYMTIEGKIFCGRAYSTLKCVWTPEIDDLFIRRNLLWFRSVSLKKDYSIATLKNPGQFVKLISDIQSNPSLALGNFKVPLVFGQIYDHADWNNLKRARFSYYACALLNYAFIAGKDGHHELINMMYDLFNYTLERITR